MRSSRSVFLTALVAAAGLALAPARPGAGPVQPAPAWSTEAAHLPAGISSTSSGIRLTGGIAMRTGVTFRDGTLEFDLAPPDGKSGFAGVAFRVASTADYEIVYFNTSDDGLRWEGVQYQPVFEGETTWQLYPGDGYQASLPHRGDPRAPGRPTHFRLVVSGRRADLYVDGAAEPMLRVLELKRDPAEGGVGVWAASREGGTAAFDHFAVTDTVRPAPAALPPVTTPPGQIMKWQVSGRLPSPGGVSVPAVLTPDMQASLDAGRIASGEASGLVNLTRVLGNPAGPQVANVFGGAGWGLALARVVVSSDRNQVVRLRFGYSDGIGVFLNGQSLFAGRNDYDSRYKGYLARMAFDVDAVDLPLHTGRNEIVLVIADKAFGWGFAARLDPAPGVVVALPVQ
jgi:hypothetical protein